MAELTPVQRRFVDLERQREEAKKFFADLNEAAQAVAAEIGFDTIFQDDKGVCYMITQGKGKWVTYDPVDYERTKREGEERSPHPLAKKRCKDAGFEVE